MPEEQQFSLSKYTDEWRESQDTVVVEGTVQEDGGYFVIDPDPCQLGLVLRVRKEDVTDRRESRKVHCQGKEHQLYFVSIKKNVPVARISLTLSDSLAARSANEEPGWYVYVRQYETQEYWCGPYSTYQQAKDAQLAFLRNPNVNAAGSPNYFDDRPTDYRYCNPNTILSASEQSFVHSKKVPSLSLCDCETETPEDVSAYSQVSGLCAPHAVKGRIYITIEVRCPKCDCFLASFSEYREASNSIYVGAIVTISYTGACYNKGECGSGRFDWRGTVTKGKVIRIE